MYEAKLNEPAVYAVLFCGRIPCEIIARHGAEFEIRITDRENKCYQYGEILTVNACNVLPQACIYYKEGFYHCRPHVWEV